MQIAEQFMIEPKEYAIQGNAILGIRDSGKSYTATAIAEKLLENNIPFVAFDPIGIWRYLKVGKDKNHKGYPIVVAGDGGDLPLTPASAPSIVKAAMQQGVSLVIDLFSLHLSKNDWKRIVEQCIRLLLYENKNYGLRHIFIEEAAEFAPQKVRPDEGKVYAEIEKLARMGGNSSLGYTLINQRPEEVNKAVLELCDCLFLHRQKGRHSITALSKWLAVSDTKNRKELIDSLPVLEKGECWVWGSGSQEPRKIKVLPKNTLHPDRRNPVPYASASKCDVTTFVKSMTELLQDMGADSQSDSADSGKPPKKRRKHEKDSGADSVQMVKPANNNQVNQLRQQVNQLKQQLSDSEKDYKQKLEEEKMVSQNLRSQLDSIKKYLKPQYDTLRNIFEGSADSVNSPSAANLEQWKVWLDKLQGKNKTMLEVLIKQGKLTKAQLALQVGMSAGGGGFNNYLSKLRTLGLVKQEGDYFTLQSM